MARVGQVKASDKERLTDRIALGVLTSTFPPSLVDEVLVASNRVEKRHRLLLARVVVYFTLAMCPVGRRGGSRGTTPIHPASRCRCCRC